MRQYDRARDRTAACSCGFRWMRIAALAAAALAMLAPGFAQNAPAPLAGRVVNGTTRQPLPDAIVERIRLQQGMVPAGETTTDRDGRFQFPPGEGDGNVPMLLRVAYQGATYSQPVVPGAVPPGGIEIVVFEASNDPKLVAVKEHAILLHPTGNRLSVLEQIFLENDSNPPRAYVNSQGTYWFSLPATARDGVQVTVEGPGGLPIPQEAVARNQENGFALAYPIRPGETQFRLQYSLDYQSPQEFSKRLDMPSEQTHIVTPGPEVQVSGEGMTALPPDTASGFVGYTVVPVGNVLRVQVAGQAAERPEAETAQAGEGSGRLEPIASPVSQQRWIILALAGLVMLGGFFYHYTR